MVKHKFPIDNVLYTYYINHPKETWVKMAQKTGLTEQTLISIAQKNKEELLKITVGTLQILHDVLGVDMME